jgi:putative ABC transport system ATP-binding protein
VSSDGRLIELEGVGKTYVSGRLEVEALREVHVRIDRGELVAIVGPSGSGKTTLLEILGCLSTPTTGRYRLAGREADQLGAGDLARLRGEQIGFVFQSFNLLPRLSALDNVELPLIYRRVPRKERHARAREALERVGLAERAVHRPSEMSGGERQRVAIARALVNRPQLVLADEPTGNLDTRTGAEIMTLLHKLHGDGSTVVMVTHDPALAAQAQRRLSIRDGRIDRDERSPGEAPSLQVAAAAGAALGGA